MQRVKNEVITNPTAVLSSTEEEIAKIRALLPPIDYEAAERDTFDVYNNIDEYGDSVACTCEIREVITYLGDDEENDVKPAITNPVMTNEVLVKNGKNGKDADESDDDETDDFCAVDPVDEVDDVMKSPPIQATVKSIFDPEYDANENLIEEMVRKKSNSAKVVEVTVENEAVKSGRVEPISNALSTDPNEMQESNECVPIINYVWDEDPMCAARAFFLKDELPRRKIELFHRKCVPGVNGFWNGIPTEKAQQDYTEDNEHVDYAKYQIWKRVVPRYDFLTCDKIPKTFNDGSPFSIPPAPRVDTADTAEVKQEPCDGLAKKNNSDIEFREWHECMNVRSYNDEVLTILPYVIID